MRAIEILGGAVLFAATAVSAPSAVADAGTGCGATLSDWRNATYAGVLNGDHGRPQLVDVQVPGDKVTVATNTAAGRPPTSRPRCTGIH
ncbi:hypothetical protein [Nocardia pseudobrasiliensis]|uniref:Peptidase inhibitor family I36 n=1 Tax=Nocardia pseudobrasiliensis TaxID=45979 RepID=A0A370I1M4_9NOCA|nr:hypothetical protein [Nocardia pseudobrasiliensis]RDI64648.1 hypothetical protein DFR76_10723 [Nocardia pseudobrasiliensis]